MPEEEIDMKRRMKGLLRIIFGRTTFAVLALSAQIGILVWCGLFFMEHIIYIFGLYILLGIAAVLLPAKRVLFGDIKEELADI